MTSTIRVLDTGALLAYAERRDPQVAYQLSFCADLGRTMLTSVLCVAEAYQRAEGETADLLDILLELPTVEIAECRLQDGDLVGVIAKRVGRLSLAHSCLLAMAEDVPLMTRDASAAHEVLEQALVWAMP
ncbi:hypothetical protein ACFQY4_13455 [Catellatospora bangladeshensis]|uniref:PIN domain-containing protein n=1 Tax=Catellatospora bangladeshensis TaxID=310355 RepID=A0A8J3JQT8_9ACTN|nr:hypothetical protein [Catellatospora bangladeshensis]GIF84983.1 hypothetical protein Cba03nite_63320 [Catellatospora bangladeshensis]